MWEVAIARWYLTSWGTYIFIMLANTFILFQYTKTRVFFLRSNYNIKTTVISLQHASRKPNLNPSKASTNEVIYIIASTRSSQGDSCDVIIKMLSDWSVDVNLTAENKNTSRWLWNTCKPIVAITSNASHLYMYFYNIICISKWTPSIWRWHIQSE